MTARRRPRVLVVDVGGTHVKVSVTGRGGEVKIPSGPGMTGPEMVRAVHQVAKDWAYDVVSVGYPGPVLRGRPVHDPANLGSGWVGLDLAKAFGKPVKLVNDAVLQALGAYRGGRMLFLGLGTGLGSVMIVEGQLAPMELAHLPYRKGGTYEDFVGERARVRLGGRKWRREVAKVVELLRAALEPDEVVLGGGNARRLKGEVPNVRRVDNESAVAGGRALWASQSQKARV